MCPHEHEYLMSRAVPSPKKEATTKEKKANDKNHNLYSHRVGWFIWIFICRLIKNCLSSITFAVIISQFFFLLLFHSETRFVRDHKNIIRALTMRICFRFEKIVSVEENYFFSSRFFIAKGFERFWRIVKSSRSESWMIFIAQHLHDATHTPLPCHYNYLSFRLCEHFPAINSAVARWVMSRVWCCVDSSHSLWMPSGFFSWNSLGSKRHKKP